MSPTSAPHRAPCASLREECGRAGLAANRAQLFLDVPTGPLYCFNREGPGVGEGLIRCCPAGGRGDA